MTFIKLLVAVLVSYSALVCAHHHFDDPHHEVHVLKGCSDVETSQDGLTYLEHGQYACKRWSGGSTYLRCVHGVVFEEKCPQTTFFDIKQEKCDYDLNLDCINPPKIDCNKAETSQGLKWLKHGQWACSKADGTSFRRCWSGTMYDWECPKGTAFNTLRGKCQWTPEDLDCTV